MNVALLPKRTAPDEIMRNALSQFQHFTKNLTRSPHTGAVIKHRTVRHTVTAQRHQRDVTTGVI